MKKNILFIMKNKISSLENIFGSKNFGAKKMKKGFTLVEMLIVVVIIGIMLTVTLNLSRSQITRMQFKLEKEDFVSSFQKIQTTFLSASYSKNGTATTGVYQIKKGEGTVNIDYGNGFSPENLGKSKIESIYVSGDRTEILSGSFIFEGYKLGCGFKKDTDPDNIITGGVVKILLKRSEEYSMCMGVELGNCRVREIPKATTSTSDYCH